MNTKLRQKVGRPATYSPEQLLTRLVQAAIDILVEQAANADFSMTQIAQRAKVSKRTVYTAIASKEELIFHIIQRNAQTATALLDAPVADAASARAVLARFLEQWAVVSCAPQAVGLYALAIRERGRFPAIGAAYYNSRTEHGLRHLVAWLERMAAKQFLRVDDATLMAEFVMAMVAAERQRMLALGMEAPLAPEQLRARVAAILRLVLRED